LRYSPGIGITGLTFIGKRGLINWTTARGYAYVAGSAVRVGSFSWNQWNCCEINASIINDYFFYFKKIYINYSLTFFPYFLSLCYSPGIVLLACGFSLLGSV